jgi:preprotein translocase subunit SecE
MRRPAHDRRIIESRAAAHPARVARATREDTAVTESNRRGERAVDDELDDVFDDDVPETAPARTVSGTRSAPARSKPAARPRARGDERLNLFAKLVNFIREVVGELQKVIWPTRKELITYTTVVVVFVASIATIVALLDLGFAKLVLLVFGTSK